MHEHLKKKEAADHLQDKLAALVVMGYFSSLCNMNIDQFNEGLNKQSVGNVRRHGIVHQIPSSKPSFNRLFQHHIEYSTPERGMIPFFFLRSPNQPT